MGRGKVNGQLSVVTSVGRKRMGKALPVQSGCALPMGRCASPPCTQGIAQWVERWSFVSMGEDME